MKARSRRQIWFWRICRAVLFACFATLFSIYWPATVRDIYAHDEETATYLPASIAPTYLIELAGDPTQGRRYTPFFADVAWASLFPEFGLDVTEYRYGSGQAAWDPDAQPFPPRVDLVRCRVGWPMRAAYWDHSMIPGKGNRQQIDAVFAKIHAEAGLRIGVARPSWMPGDQHRRVPVVPIGAGVFVNIVVFASVWLTPGVAWRAAKAHRRRRRGQCVPCGYQLAGNSRCPECGTEV